MTNGLVAMPKKSREKLGLDKLVIFNGLREGNGAEFLPTTSGAMIEHFGYFSSDGKECMVKDMAAMTAAGRAGKIVIFKAWPGFSWLDKDMMEKPQAKRVQLARERITLPLACFLVAAEAHCYFCYT